MRMKRRAFLGTVAMGAAGAVIADGKKRAAGTGIRASSHTIREPEKHIPVVGEYDVCVLGGSATGVFAAVRAAQMGAKVAIVEKQNAFGGVAASGLVSIWHTLHSKKANRQIIGGLTEQVLKSLDKVEGRAGTRLNTDELKIELDRLVIGHGVTPYLHTIYVAPQIEAGRVAAVFIENKSGRQAIRARVFVDATGDGDLAKDAGLPFEIRDGLQPPTTCAEILGLPKDIKKLIEEHREEFGLAKDHGWDAVIPGMQDARLYALTHVFNTNAADAEQLTAAEIEGRRQVRAYMDIARKYGGANNKPILLDLPSYIGIRETRSFKANYRLTTDDIVNGTRFPDAIGNGTYKIDVHDPVNGAFKRIAHKCDFYQIPLSTMVNDKAPNIVLAGRMICTDRNAFGAIRVMVNLNQTGEAAGVTAALAIAGDQSVPEVAADAVRGELSNLGAIVI